MNMETQMNLQERREDPHHACCVAAMKARIKEWAHVQHEERLAVKAAQRAGQDASTGQTELFARSVEITALLNVYLELRGRSYRHGIPENAHLLYPACRKRALQWMEEHLQR